jgi:pimeloyl-ACP methyl ester carboxylesterase
MTDVHNVVLVHGGFVDGSGWQGVYEALTADGYRVAVVQNPTLSLEGDAALTRQVINGLDGPVVLAGHSYGGAVITAAGTPNTARSSQKKTALRRRAGVRPTCTSLTTTRP